MVLLNLFRRQHTLAVLGTALGLTTVPVLAGTLSLFNPFFIDKQAQILHVDTQLFLANDPFSLEALFDDFEGKYAYKKNQNYAIGDIRVDVGTYINSLGYIGYTYRKEAIIEISSDTAKLIHQVSNDQNLNSGETYDLFIKIEGFEVQGLTWANTFPLYQKYGWDIQVGFGAELLYGTEGQDGYALGNATANGESDYDFALYSNYSYTDNYLYDYDVPKTTAFGYTTHVALQASYKDFTLLALINDAWGKLYWKNLPYSEVLMSSRNKSYDENGYVEYAPLISGIERNKDFTQTLMRKWRVEAQYKFGKAKLHIGNDRIYGVNIPYVRYDYTHNSELILHCAYETTFNMFGAGVKYKNYRFEIYSNDIIHPSAMKLQAQINYPF